jgi:HPt (histidine-containing phosphotransfer) domain-containing protein
MSNPTSHQAADRALDLVHLAHHTLGDQDLEREILQLFAAQSRTLLARLEAAREEERAYVAHTLKGSARAIGAWEVVRAAEAVETDAEATTTALAQAVGRVNAMIRDLAA